MIQLRRVSFLSFLFFLFGSFLFLSSAQAAKIYRVKGKKVYLKLSKSESQSLEKGARLLVYSRSKKKRGILVLRTVKGNRALAVLKKGKAKKSWIARARKQKNKNKNKNKNKDTMVAKNEVEEKKTSSQANSALKKWTYGIYGGLYMTTMEILVSSESTEVVTKSGTNFGVKGYMQYNWTPSLAITAVMGYQGFSSKGTAVGNNCNSTTVCDTQISFLASELWGKYYLSRSKYSYWLGAGGALNFPLQKTSTILVETDIGLTNFLIIGGGLEILLSSGKSIPLSFEFAQMPSTAAVKANYIGINVGYQF